jgi:hypothetical protein
MNRKQLIFLLVVMGIIGSAGLVLLKQKKESWTAREAKMGDKVLPNFQYNDVAAIHIKGGSELNLARKNGLWRVQERSDYPADFHQISDLLIKIRNLKVVQADEIGPSQLASVDLNEPGKGSGSGTLVEFKDAQGKVLDALLLGKRHMREQNESRPSPFGAGSPDGRYILLHGGSSGESKEALLISDALANLEPMPEQWLSRDFFKVEKVKSISVVPTGAASAWKASRETEASPWILADAKPGEMLDTNKISMAANALAFPAFVDIASTNDPAQTGLDKPLVATFETFDHFTYTVKIGSKSPEGRYHVTVAVAAPEQIADKTSQDKLKQEQALALWVYTVNSWILDALIHERAQILADNKENVQAGSTASTPIENPFAAKTIPAPGSGK